MSYYLNITIEQARALEAVARLGTVQRAADELHRGHTAILYLLKGLEQATELKLFERFGRSNRLTAEGQIALKYCRKILDDTQEFSSACRQLKSGWEPSLKLIYDEVIDFHFICQAVHKLNRKKPLTEIKILSAHLGQVEEVFSNEQADMMVTILPLQKMQIKSKKLVPIEMVLVAHREHALVAESKNRKLGVDDLNRHTYITISTSRGQIGLGTEQMQFDSYFVVNSFLSKKIALLSGLGFGWLPDYLIRSEIEKGALRKIRTEISNTHTLYPQLYFRNEASLGAAARELLINISKGAAR